jgi:hypothetical protein
VHIGWLDRYRVGSVYDDVDSVVFVLMCLVVALFFLVNAGELRFFVFVMYGVTFSRRQKGKATGDKRK